MTESRTIDEIRVLYSIDANREKEDRPTVWGRDDVATLLAEIDRLSALAPAPVSALVSAPVSGEFLARLAPRERGVVTRLVEGASTRDISKAMGLTISTVNTYMKRIFAKLDVHTRIELVAKATGRS